MWDKEITLPTHILRKVFIDLDNLFKGRDIEKVFQISADGGILKIQATSLLFYETVLLTDSSLEDFKVVCSFRDLSEFLLGEKTKLTITPSYIQFQSGGADTLINTSYSTVEVINDTDDLQRISINCDSLCDCFKRLKKLTNLYKEFPSHQSIHCKNNFAYVITPIAYIYVKGCPIETTIDRYTADFLSYFCEGAKSVELSYSNKFLKLYSRTTTLYIPKVDSFNNESNNLLRDTSVVCKIGVDLFKSEIQKIKSRYQIMLGFKENSIYIEIDTIDFKYKNSIKASIFKSAYVVTDALFLYTVLSLFDNDSIVEIRKGEGLLVLQTNTVKVFLSCLN